MSCTYVYDCFCVGDLDCILIGPAAVATNLAGVIMDVRMGVTKNDLILRNAAAAACLASLTMDVKRDVAIMD